MFITSLTERHSSLTDMAYFLAVITKTDFLFLVALRRNAGQGLLIQDVSRSHTTTRYSR